MQQTTPIAYCGIPAIPATVWQSWNFDPPLLLALTAFGLAAHRLPPGLRRNCAWGALALGVIVFVSPLCALSAALFSARVLHHVLLIAGVAPLLALAFPARRALPLAPLFLLHVVVLWAWHVPGLYAWGLAWVPGYWLMQLSLLGTAFLLWREVLRLNALGGADAGAGITVLLGTVGQMGLLGALIVFAQRPLYAAHALTTETWGLSALEDQQLAGLIMWVPAFLPYLVAAAWMGARILAPPRGA